MQRAEQFGLAINVLNVAENDTSYESYSYLTIYKLICAITHSINFKKYTFTKTVCLF